MFDFYVVKYVFGLRIFRQVGYVIIVWKKGGG